MHKRFLCRVRPPAYLKFTLQILLYLLAIITLCYTVSFLVSHMHTLIVIAFLVGIIAVIQILCSHIR